MRKLKISYRIITILFAAFMFMSAVPDLLNDPQAIVMIHDQLGYPSYFIPFIGIAKILGVIAILIPRFPRLKEWAYAGLSFDLIGATYSMIAIGQPISNWIFMILPLSFGFCSYIMYHKLLHSNISNTEVKPGELNYQLINN